MGQTTPPYVYTYKFFLNLQVLYLHEQNVFCWVATKIVLNLCSLHTSIRKEGVKITNNENGLFLVRFCPFLGVLFSKLRENFQLYHLCIRILLWSPLFIYPCGARALTLMSNIRRLFNAILVSTCPLICWNLWLFIHFGFSRPNFGLLYLSC